MYVIIITFQTANPNWESQMPKTPKAPAGKEKTFERKENNDKNKQQQQKVW